MFIIAVGDTFVGCVKVYVESLEYGVVFIPLLHGGIFMSSPSRSYNISTRDLLHERLNALLDECDQIVDNADLDDFLFAAEKNFIREWIPFATCKRYSKWWHIHI